MNEWMNEYTTLSLSISLSLSLTHSLAMPCFLLWYVSFFFFLCDLWGPSLALLSVSHFPNPKRLWRRFRSVDPMDPSPSNILAGGAATLSVFWFRCSHPWRCCFLTTDLIAVPDLSLTKSLTEDLSFADVILTQCLTEMYGVREGKWYFPIPSLLSSLSHSIHRLTNVSLIGSAWLHFLFVFSLTFFPVKVTYEYLWLLHF